MKMFFCVFFFAPSDTVTNASGPLLVEIAKSPGATLGINLTSANHRNKQVIVIDRVKPGSVVDRYTHTHSLTHVTYNNVCIRASCSLSSKQQNGLRALF